MKFVNFSILSMLVLAVSAQAETGEKGFLCYQITKPNARYSSILRVKLTERKELKNTSKKWDLVYDANLLVERVKGHEDAGVVLFDIDGYSHSEDVNYEMTKDGVRFYVFLDEQDEAGVEYKDENGNAVRVSLSCERIETEEN